MSQTTIPEELRQDGFRFILLGHWQDFKNKDGSTKRIPGKKTPQQLKQLKEEGWLPCAKTPLEREWQTKNNYGYAAPKLIKHLSKGNNYGIATGFGGLAILDDDSPNLDLISLFQESFGATHTVKTGSGGLHLYLCMPDLDKKLIFYDSNGQHFGELQFKSQQVVGPGSIHPLGEEYKITTFNKLLSLTAREFRKAFKKYIKEKKVYEGDYKKTDWSGDRIQDIPLKNIISLAGFVDRGNGCFQGSHPVHGSTGGMNFYVNTAQNKWVCFRCGNSGGGPAELIGVVEGIIDCSQAGKNCYSPEQGKEVIRIAREKYGLKAHRIAS